MPDAPENNARHFAVATLGFLLPLAIFFGWFFGVRGLSFVWILAALLLLLIAALIVGARCKSSRTAKIGATWLFTGCLAALFWALLINGLP